MKKEERFVVAYHTSGLEGIEILIDTETGVNYLFVRKGYAGGLTPLLDANGAPVISADYVKKDVE